jgi:nitroimidazol reductase NimA-like FMN-containing flavoprotein (pyridoxamine 5'-phosphate oxidase superfamily)
MTEFTSDSFTDGPPAPAPLEPLSEAECWQLLRGGGIGRVGYSGRFGQVIVPINYEVRDQALYFRVAQHSPTGEDLRTGIAHADYRIAFEADHFDEAAHSGWSVLMQGDVHPMETEEEQAFVTQICVEPWVAGPHELFLRITPTHLTGRRIGHGLDAG